MSQTRLSIPQGTTYAVEWPILTEDTAEPIDPTGYTARAQARPYTDSGEVLYEWSTTNGTLAFFDNRLRLTVGADVSSAWTWDHAVFDIEIYAPSGATYRVVSGVIDIVSEVTR